MESSHLGVLFCVEPWNFPYYQLARVAGAQLMAGNVLVVKHAGCVPQCAIAFEKLLLDAGAPLGAYTNLLISHEQSERVIDDPRIKAVWTKDEARGKRVASQIDTGMMFVNNLDWADADLPFGGIKNSGYGRELGSMGMQEFVNKKVVRSGYLPAPT